MSHLDADFNFPPVGTPMSQDQPHLAIASENQSPLGFSLFGSRTAPSQQFRDVPLSPTPIIDPLLVDNFAKDFQLEPVQCANLRAFIQVTHCHC